MPLPPARKVLFIGEGATLAHVARPYVLANTLPADRFDVVFARPATFAWLTSNAGFRTTDLPCQDGSVFARRLAQGLPLYDYTTLKKYVKDDLALIDAETPDVIIGDFRLSLSVSARLRSVPYIALCDAYWSPESALQIPLPVLPLTRFIPLPIAQIGFRCVSGLAFRLHSTSIERIRARYGLPSLGFDLRRCYTDADFRLFANFAVLFPEVKSSRHAAFIGPIAWSPKASQPIEFLQAERPFIYVSMGSSGRTSVLTTLIPILEETGYRVIVTTAGKPIPGKIRSDVTRVYDYLPGDVACRNARLVVCNGGSPTTNQALSHGVPVLGIAWNMDQFLNMRAIEDYGAGILVRGDRADEKRLRNASQEIMTNLRYGERAQSLARDAAGTSFGRELIEVIDRLLGD